MDHGGIFTWPVRVYYDDTDLGGIVYHGNYLRMMEHARTEWLRDLGIEQDELLAREGKVFAVVDMTVEFRKPAAFNERLLVTAEVVDTTTATFTFRQGIYRNDLGGDLLCTGRVRAACMKKDTQRPVRLPELLRRRMQARG